MKKLFIAGNWKSNKTTEEAGAWLEKLNVPQIAGTVVVCAPFTALAPMHWAIGQRKLPIELGAQDVSPFGDGAYTGEVSARQVKELAGWVIIGHSERRNYFGETDELLGKKTAMAKEAGLKVIYCVQDAHTAAPQGVDVIAYEPVWAIGTGKTDTPQNAASVVSEIKSRTGVQICIYGGSVTAENVKDFVSTDVIDGVLPGGASLDPGKFGALVTRAAAQ